MSTQPSVFPLLMLAYVGWMVYRRTRRHIGRQQLQPKRTILRIAFFGVIGLVTAVIAFPHSQLDLSLGAGFLVGLPVAFLGLHLTRFEVTNEGHYYTPNTYIGLAVSLLLVVRLAYRGYRVYSMSQSPSGFQNVAYSGLTMFLFGLLASYYVAYYTGVFIKCHQLQMVQK